MILSFFNEEEIGKVFKLEVKFPDCLYYYLQFSLIKTANHNARSSIRKGVQALLQEIKKARSQSGQNNQIYVHLCHNSMELWAIEGCLWQGIFPQFVGKWWYYFYQ